MISNKIVIQSVPGKGVGVLACEDIKPGDLLISEPPLVVFTDWSPDNVLETWKSLSDKDKVTYLSLSNCHSGITF